MENTTLNNEQVSANGDLSESTPSGPDLSGIARKLGDELRSSELWSEWSEAQEDFRTDEEAQQIIRDYQLTLQKIEQELPPGENQLSDDQIDRIKQVEEKIRENDVIQRREQAIGNLVQAFKQFSDHLADDLGLDLFQFAAQTKGGCGCEDGSCDC